MVVTEASQATPSPDPQPTGSETSSAAIMFRKIRHFEATNSEFNNRVGDEINVNSVERSRDVVACEGTSTDN